MASYSSKRYLQDTAKIKSKKKNIDVDLDKNKSKNIKLVKSNEAIKTDLGGSKSSTSDKKVKKLIGKEISNSLTNNKTKHYPKKGETNSNAAKSVDVVTKIRENTFVNNLKKAQPKRIENALSQTKIMPERLKSDVSITTTNKSTPKSLSPHEEQNYEDDFDSYESDFEEYSSSSLKNLSTTESTSSLNSYYEELKHSKENINHDSSGNTEDEKKFDSGHFDMQDYKHRPILDNIKEAIDKENTDLLLLANNPASLSDEGFEDQKSFQFVNFLDAQKKWERRKSIEMKRKRGKEILNMIKLNSCNFTLIEFAPISYESFVKSFGKRNTVQASCQTGMDGIDEDIQTDDINQVSKWTQQPEVFINASQNNLMDYKLKREKNYDLYSLNKFIVSAGEVILIIQEESAQTIHKKHLNTKSNPLGDSYSFDTSSDIFIDAYVSHILFSSVSRNEIITVHVRYDESIIAMWNIFNYEKPGMIFICNGNISCCSSGIIKHEIIFSGLEDGTILIWDGTRKMSADNEVGYVPLFSTGINTGHQTKVIALHLLNHSSDQANELCSIDEDGEIILWTIMLKNSDEEKNESKNKLVLIKNASVSLKRLYPDMTDLQCTDSISNQHNSYYIYISTNYGFIVHYLIKAGRTNSKLFVPELQSIGKSLESCPFSRNYFLAGYENGNIALYSTSSKKPLIILSDKDNEMKSTIIEFIQWSRHKSTVIYSKQGKNMINVWDLNESDMFSLYSIPYKEEITCMKISPSTEGFNENPLMLIGTSQGNVYLHYLNEEHSEPVKNIENTKTFLNYVKLL